MEQKFLNFIIEEKKKQRMTDYKLAQRIGVAQSSVGRWFKGESPITIGNYLAICKVLRINRVIIESDDKGTSTTLLLGDE